MTQTAPVVVIESRCKACSLCVEVCPSGTLAMRAEPKSALGAMASVIAPQDCVGCNECELCCPDFAITVADRKTYKFAKLTEQSRAAAEAIRVNGYYAPKEKR
ncbi:MAG: 4Fe-4S binding protein [Helicobacteraceae bacterium]|jgi:2-oxoglutarate ferredoxin oxidoreductase subunit delta|nr:4Fe-4S binding protein [Helicobacteraceae bacterium]